MTTLPPVGESLPGIAADSAAAAVVQGNRTHERVERSTESYTTKGLHLTGGEPGTQSQKARVGEFLLAIDEVWARESELIETSRMTEASHTMCSSFFEGLGAALLNLYASMGVYLKYLITVESFLVALISIGATLMFSLYEVKGHRLAVNVSWAFISFAIIFPLTYQLNETFKRREAALRNLADLKAFLLSYYLAHRDWDWGKNGRKNLPKHHVHCMRYLCVQLVRDMRDLLTAPSTSRQVHYYSKVGRQQRAKMQSIQREITQRITVAFHRISLAVEELKYAGQPGNESSRMRQYITLTMKAWENLRYIKRYRTPIATRAFARVYIFLHPIFWGPYYAYLVEEMLQPIEDDPNTKVPLYTVIMCNVYACLLSVLTSLAMMGLFNVRYRLEDPFGGETTQRDAEGNMGVDQIHVNQEMAELVHSMTLEFVDANSEEGGGGPSALMYPLPDTCQVVNLELTHRFDIDSIMRDTA